jgi:Putative zinc-finger
MSACRDFEPLLLQRASQTLTPEDSVLLEKHLAGCAACAAEAQAFAQALSLAKLPPLSVVERTSLHGLALSALAAWHRAERDRTLIRRAALGLTAAAALAAVAIAPSLARKERPKTNVSQMEDPTLAALESWGAEDPLADPLAESILVGMNALDD